MVDPEVLHLLQLNTTEPVFIRGIRAYGVFDGHGINGHHVSAQIRNTLPSMPPRNHAENLYKYLLPLHGSYDSALIRDAIVKAYLLTNQELWMADFDTNLSGTPPRQLFQEVLLW